MNTINEARGNTWKTSSCVQKPVNSSYRNWRWYSWKLALWRRLTVNLYIISRTIMMRGNIRLSTYMSHREIDFFFYIFHDKFMTIGYLQKFCSSTLHSCTLYTKVRKYIHVSPDTFSSLPSCVKVPLDSDTDSSYW